jgi:mycothiol synthase
MSKPNIRRLRPQEYNYAAKIFAEAQRCCEIPAVGLSLASPAATAGSGESWAIEDEAGGKLIGCASYALAEGTTGLYRIAIALRPAERGRGIGSAVYERMQEALRARGAERLLACAYTHQLAGLRFLARRGFREAGCSHSYQLNVAAADEPGGQQCPQASVAAQGLRMTTLDRFPRLGLAERLLPLWNRTRPDQPQFWPFVPYQARRLEQEMLAPDAVALADSFAIVAPAGQIVAFTLSARIADDRLHTIYLGVDPEFRRRGLASALKLKLIAHAQARGIAFLSAENDARNTVMAALNRRLGFRHLAELLVYQKSLDA